MTSVEIKNIVFDKINKIQDPIILLNINSFLEDLSTYNGAIDISDKHLEAIKIADNEINRGEFLTNKQANNEVMEWLRK